MLSGTIGELSGCLGIVGTSLPVLKALKLMRNRDAIVQDDLMKAVRKLNDAKKHETKM